MSLQIEPGLPLPLGSNWQRDGVNFSLLSEHATQVTLLLFTPGSKEVLFQIPLEEKTHRTGWTWHVLIKGLPYSNLEYAYLVKGPNETPKQRFKPNTPLSDPYSRALSMPQKWGEQRIIPPRSKLVPPSDFNWEGDRPPKIPMEELIIYEMHVRAFTEHSSSQVKHPGSFLGIIEKIPHLKSLGINAVELMPIFEFDECENHNKNPTTGGSLYNFWGYSTINFFAPMQRYSATNSWTGAIDDFRTLVKELHKNGIEVFLDVVYNHTAEGPADGPYFSFRGIDNEIYYILDCAGHYLNFSGTGNTFNANHPVVLRLITESLRYWVSEMHVDGFRFDLASCLTRDEEGNPMPHSPLIHLITHDPILAEVKLIAEAWDAAGLYQVGSFQGEGRWAEWNGKYRDDVRRFLKGTPEHAGRFATVMCGSQDLYGKTAPFHSINFITAHDGFTLRDLVSYQDKHNLSNGEDNRDGSDQNDSWNCGEEGATSNVHILKIREQQMRNLHTALMLSIGIPMLLMGDEYGHTRNGNNNAYCQDNELNWFLWDELEKNKDFARFHRLVVNFRKKHKILQRREFLKDSDVQWHSHKPLHPDWHAENRFVAYTLKDPVHHEPLYIAFNADFKKAEIALPADKKWYRIIDTALPSPQDFNEDPKSSPLSSHYEMLPYSSFVAKALS